MFQCTRYWFMAASSSAKACALTASSMPPLACVSKRVDAAAVPNEELVEERADTALFTFFWLLFFVFFFLLPNKKSFGSTRGVCVVRQCCWHSDVYFGVFVRFLVVWWWCRKMFIGNVFFFCETDSKIFLGWFFKNLSSI